MTTKSVFKRSTFLILLLALFLIRCNGISNSESENSSINDAINLTKKKEAIKDSIQSLKKRGATFIVCYIRKSKDLKFLTFDMTHHKNAEIRPFYIAKNFAIEKFGDIDVLFLDTSDTIISRKQLEDKKTQVLIKKGFITFDGNGGCRDYDYVQFVFCKSDPENFTSFNREMSIEMESKMRAKDLPYQIEVFYPKCK
jgi:hypothetical protein